MPAGLRLALTALGTGLLAALATLGVSTTPVRLEPGTRGWERCVSGTTADGTLSGRAMVVLPGVDRLSTLTLLVEAQGLRGGPASLGVSPDRGAPQWLQVPEKGPGLWVLPPTGTPGARLVLSAGEGAVRLRTLEVRGTWHRATALVMLIAVAGLTHVLLSLVSGRLALALGLFGAGLAALFASPLLLFWTLPSPASAARVALLGLFLLVGVALGARQEPRRFALGAALLTAALFGAWVRAHFLPSSGSWDTDYWKACTLRVASEGVTRAYGDPGSVPAGHLLAQLRGEEPLWEAQVFGRSFVVDQPPGIMALWRASWWVVSRAAPEMDRDEALNVAAKLPPVAGDLFAVGVLLWAFRDRRERGLTLAALYWALPVSWLSSAVLGYFDGAYVPLAVAALVAAGRGQPRLAGSLLAAAALVKALALLIAPAVAVALFAARAPLRRAALWGFAFVALALAPFVADGTLLPAVVHVYRILFQERLSGGYANPWWIAGHFLTLGEGTRAFADPIPFVRIETLHLPVRALGAALFVAAAAACGRLQARCPGPGPAALGGATLVFTYGMLAIGIHENHPHALPLALLATGLPSRRLRLLALALALTDVLNMLALSGIGRFYSLRYLALEPLARLAVGLRMGLGFDVTLALAVVNLVAFAALLAGLGREMEGLGS